MTSAHSYIYKEESQWQYLSWNEISPINEKKYV